MIDQLIADCEQAIKGVKVGWKGAGQAALHRRVLSLTTQLDDERNRLFVKLNNQWHWLEEHEDPPSEEYEDRFLIYQRTLARYCAANDQLAAAKAVL